MADEALSVELMEITASHGSINFAETNDMYICRTTVWRGRVSRRCRVCPRYCQYVPGKRGDNTAALGEFGADARVS